jgi:hypothetical protein
MEITHSTSNEPNLIADSGKTLMMFKPLPSDNISTDFLGQLITVFPPAKNALKPPLRQIVAMASLRGRAVRFTAASDEPFEAVLVAELPDCAIRNTLIRSKGAVAVLDNAPATPPARKYPIPDIESDPKFMSS